MAERGVEVFLIVTVAPDGGGAVAVPSPDTEMPCGLPVPLDTTLTVPPRGPTSDGRKLISIEQVPPTATVVHELAATRNSLVLLVTPDTATGPVPVLVTVTRLFALVVPSVCEPKASDDDSESLPAAGGGVTTVNVVR